MNKHLKTMLSVSVYFVIPLITILICRALKLAQGEKNDEIVFGIMSGLFLDFVYSIVLMLLDRHKRSSH